MSIPPDGQTALIVPVALPAALDQMRGRLDPSAADGVPGHVTLLVPFVPPAELDDAVLHRVGAIAGSEPAFAFVLRTVQRWPNVVCLLPEPHEPFDRLIRALAVAFPDYPPYGGAHALDDVVAHVTIAVSSSDEVLDAAAGALPNLLPVSARCDEIRLIARQPGQLWQPIWSYRLPAESAG